MMINLEGPARVASSSFSFLKKNALMLLGLGISAIILFFNTLKFPMPIGFGGLYTLMAEEISRNNFLLPDTVPYYGPGGIPFAYPPLGFYVMAVALRLDISYISYLRFFPPFCTLISLIPLFLLARQYTRSNLASTITIIYVAFSPAVYVTHVWAAGIVRALALLLLLGGLYLLELSRKESGVGFGIFAGILCGLTCLTHLLYGLFLALWVVAVVGIDLRSITWRKWLPFILAGVLTVAPWVVIVGSRYGFYVFSNALFSHNNVGVVDLIQVPSQFIAWILAKMTELITSPIAYVAIGLGLVQLVLARQYTVPLVLAMSLSLLTAGGDRFFVLLIAILIGASVMNSGPWLQRMAWIRYLLTGLTMLALFIDGLNGIRVMGTMGPGLEPSAFQVATYVRENTPAQSRYLFVTGQTEAEWFPYLLQRDPLVSLWGSEWLGTYDEQSRLQSRVSDCRDAQSLECLKQLHLKILPDDLLITRRAQRRLSAQLELDSLCSRMVTLGRYIIWKAQCISG